MTRVTDFRCVNDNGDRVLCDAYGNNVAFKSRNCGHPMLAIVLPKGNSRGSNPDNPSVCRHCGFRAWPMLYGIQPYDPLSMTSGALILLAVALAASWISARRAARVQPMKALRHESTATIGRQQLGDRVLS